MKISLIIFFVLIVQVSTSFLDVFQGAMHSVQNSFGKLLTDVVTDVKETVDCTILAIEQVFSLSADATALYNDKCGSGNNTTVTNHQPNNSPTLEISFLNNQDYLNKLLPEDIDSRINDTIVRIFQGYNPHDKLADVERELAEETKRLAGISNLVKQELEKLSAEIHIDLSRHQRNDTKPTVDNILQELRLLEAIEKNIKNSSEADEIHKVVENVLHKLNAIEASEVSENAKVDKILKDLENNSNGTYKDLRKRLEDWKNEEDRHLDIIKKKLEQHKASPEHSAYIEKNKLNNIPQFQPNDFINSNDSNSSAEIMNNSTHTAEPEIISSIMNSNGLAALNTTPLYGSTTSLANVTTTTISTIFAMVGSLPKKSSAKETPEMVGSLLKNSSVDTTTTISATLAIVEILPNKSSVDTTSTISTTPAILGSLPKKSSVDTTSTISTTHAIVGSLPNKSSVNKLAQITPLTSNKLSTNTKTLKIVPKTTENILTESSTDSGVHLVRPLFHRDLLPVIITTTPALSSSVSVPPTPTELSTMSASPLPLNTTVKIYQPSTKSNNIEQNNVSINRTSTESTILMFTTPETVKSTTVTAEQIITSIGTHKLSTSTQINDEVKITTPVSIPTSSYVNKHKSSITESILNTVSSTMINTIANTLNQDLQPDKTVTTIAPPTTKQMAIVDVDRSIISTTSDVTSEISIIPTTQRYYSNDDNLSSTITTTPSTVDSHDVQDVSVESTTSQVTLKVSKQPTITTPSLDAYLKYVDRIVTSTPISITTKSKEIPDIHANKEMQDPWLTHSQNVLSRATPEVINSNSIAPLNDKFATRPYDHPSSQLNKDIPGLTGFKPPKTVYYHDPPLSARNGRIMKKEKLPSNIFLPPRSSYTSLKKSDGSLPYTGINNNPVPKRKMPHWSQLMAAHRRDDENSPLDVKNNRGPPDVFNHKLDTHRGTNPKLNHFDDPDYDTFFHIPSKDAEHERALREARKLIEDSQKAHRVMQRILDNKNKKGINAFNLPSSLNFGR